MDEIFTIYEKLAASHFLSYTERIIREAFRSETSFLFLPSKNPSEKRKQWFCNMKKTLSDMLSVSGLPGLQTSALPLLILPVPLTGVQCKTSLSLPLHRSSPPRINSQLNLALAPLQITDLVQFSPAPASNDAPLRADRTASSIYFRGCGSWK